jgi:hypothetical protein
MGYGKKYVLNLISEAGQTGTTMQQSIYGGFTFDINNFVNALHIDMRKKYWLKVNQFRFSAQALTEEGEMDIQNTILVHMRGFNQSNAFMIEADDTNPVSTMSDIILHAGSNTTYEHSHGGDVYQHPNLQCEYVLISKPIIQGYFDQSSRLNVYFTGINMLTQNPPAVLGDIRWSMVLEFIEYEDDSD